MITLLFQLFWTFFLIGLFGFGGGYAMISMIQGEVVEHHHWMTMGQFTDIVAVSQSTPGPIGINSATYVGYTAIVNAGYAPAWGVLGSLLSTFAVVLPSFALMLFISKFLMKHRSNPSVEHVFSGLRPAVVGLIAAATLLLMNSENFSSMSEKPWRFCLSVMLFVFAFVAQKVYRLGAILIILLCGTAGIILGL